MTADLLQPGDKTTAARPRVIAGVDIIRFVAAVWVAFGHGARFPVDQLISKHADTLSMLAVGVSNMIFNGSDAVIVFFIVSGLCIHYPNVGSPSLDARAFLIRRIVRIGIPLIAIIGLSELMGKFYYNSLAVVLWTVYCELAYYAFYPILFELSKIIQWPKLTIFSCAISVSMLVRRPHTQYLWEFGYFTWLYCLPFWLAGVLLAAQFEAWAPTSAFKLWLWRGGAAALCLLSGILQSHSPLVVGLPWTTPVFAVYGYFWLQREFAHWRDGAPRGLEILGLFSYSLYLTHKLVLTFFDARAQSLGPVGHWALQLAALGALAYGFYLAIERPSHLLARRLGARRRLGAASAAPTDVRQPIV